MTRRTLMIGRSSHADIVIADDDVDAHHGELVMTSDGRLYLSDRASGIGTLIRRDGTWEPLRQSFIEDTDEMCFGKFRCTGDDLRKRALSVIAESEPGGAQAGGRSTGYLRGSVERDPATGEIVRRKF